MKTKDFIKMLQEADPSGEAYVRIDGGAPAYAWLKEGYWDGPYAYLDENGVYVKSTAGMKVDIYTRTPEDIIWDCHGDMDEIRKRIRIEYTYLNDDRQKEFWKYVEEEAKTAKEWDEKSKVEFFEKHVKPTMDSGYIIIQDKDDPIGHYHVTKYFNPITGEKESMMQGECHVVLKSGKFESIEKEEYIQWVLK